MESRIIVKKLRLIMSLFVVAVLFITGCAPKEEVNMSKEIPEGKPDTWIADRTIKGLVFMSDGDVSAEMNPEIAKELKEKTGITLDYKGFLKRILLKR